MNEVGGLIFATFIIKSVTNKRVWTTIDSFKYFSYLPHGYIPHIGGKQIDHNAQQHADSQAAERFKQAWEYEVLQSVFHKIHGGGHNTGHEQAYHCSDTIN